MPPPKRHAVLGSEESVLEDLALTRDAGGLVRCGAERLQGTLFLLFGSTTWMSDHIETARQRLTSAVEQGCATFAAAHRGEPCSEAAAASLHDILTQSAGSWITARALRRAARQRFGRELADDSLRKREQPIIRLIAQMLFSELSEQEHELLPTRDSIVQVLRPYADVAGMAVELGAKLFSQRAALNDDQLFYRAVADAIWAVAQFGALPVYGLQRLEALGIRDLSDEAIEYLLHTLIRLPFVAEPDDLNQLSTAVQLGETPDRFYDRLLVTPVMRPVIERFVLWLASHDPKVCLFDSNDVMVGYCGPHYYVAMCECFVQAAEDYSSGEFARDMAHMLQAAGLAHRGRRNGATHSATTHSRHRGLPTGE